MMDELRFRSMPTTSTSHRYAFGATVDLIPSPHRRAVTDWCIEQFGRSGSRWFTPAAGAYCFRDENDAIKFKMRWG